MARLYDNESGSLLGQVTDAQLQFLIDRLEETHASDRDYYVDVGTIDMLEDDGGDAELVALLRRALDGRDGVELRWEATE